MMGTERRGDLRGARQERLFVKVASSDATANAESLIISGATVDVSSSGLSLMATETLAEGSRLELWVEIKGCPGKFLLTGLVRWCQPQGDEFSCGIELLDDGPSDLVDWQDLFV